MAAKSTKRPAEASSIGAETLHKSSSVAVPSDDYNIPIDPSEDHLWFVAMLSHQKYTVDCCRYLSTAVPGQMCQCYVPSKEELHVYPNRTKRKVRKYIIPRMVFVTGLDEEQAYHLTSVCPYVDYFLPDRARERAHGHVALASIRQRDMVTLQRAIDGVVSADDISFTPADLSFDEQIEVVSGDLRGMEGGYYRSEGNDYLVFMLGKLGNIKVRVSIADCTLKKV